MTQIAYTLLLITVLACPGLSKAAGAKKKKSAPLKIVPVTEEEKAKLLAAETTEQKALREELKTAGKIYFNANVHGQHDIFVINADGTGLKRLTDDPESDTYPHCSPDGKRIVFNSNRIAVKRGKPLPAALKDLPCDPKYPVAKPPHQKWDRRKGGVIWIMNADGTEPKPLILGSLPHWSPDGKYVAYSIISSPWPNQLGILNVETKTDTCISDRRLRNCGMPCFTPDGDYIIGANGSAYLLKLNKDKTGIENAVRFDNGHPCNGEISPDGKFWTYVVDTNKNMGSWLKYRAMVYPSAGRKRAVSLKLGWKKGSINYFPDFSPDGKYLVYVHAESQPGVKSWTVKSKQEIYITRFPKCETTIRITWNGAGNQHPQWVK